MWTVETKQKQGHTWIELRKLFNRKPCYGNILIIVSDGEGYFYKNEVPDSSKVRYSDDSKGVNVRMSINGPIALTFEEFEDMQLQIQRAKELLNTVNGD